MKQRVGNTGFALALILEILAIVLTVSADKSKRVFTLNTFSQVISRMYTISFNIRNYFYLGQENEKLISANKQLLTRSFNCQKLNDTIYDLVLANVVKNSVNRANNLLIISAGERQGVKPEDGVISASGNIVGTVISVGKNYSSVLSVLNKISSISVLHEKTNTMGVLSWEDVTTPRYMALSGIPIYIPVHVGDTIITSGYSQIFPKGVVVGTVASVKKTGRSNSYDIKVLLAEDFNRLNHVFVIKNGSKEEIKQIEKEANKILGLE